MEPEILTLGAQFYFHAFARDRTFSILPSLLHGMQRDAEMEVGNDFSKVAKKAPIQAELLPASKFRRVPLHFGDDTGYFREILIERSGNGAAGKRR